MQLPATARVTVTPTPTADAPHGYVLLPSHFRPELLRSFPPPPHVRSPAGENSALEIGFKPNPEKLGFIPRPLVGLRDDLGNARLTLQPGVLQGTETGRPDDGYLAQVYLGGREAFIEIEQLSPLLLPDADGDRAFEVVLIPAQP